MLELTFRRTAMFALTTAVACLVNTAATAQSGATVVTFFDLQTSAPTSWTKVEPSSSMRLLQMSVPGVDPAAAAEVVAFFFGAGQGGNVQDNIARWESQFTGADGGPVDARINGFEAGGMLVTVAELSGTYRRNVGSAPAEPLSDQTLVAAIVQTGQGSLFIQLHGPSSTVAQHRRGFDSFLRGLRPAED